MGSGSEVSILIAFSAGLLTFLSPCVLPLFPSYITYITGKSFEDIKTSGSSSAIRRLTAVHSLFFIVGFSIIFVLLGTTISYLGSFFGIKRIWLERIGGVLIILFGLNISGLLNIGFLGHEKTFLSHRKNFSYISSLLIGMAFAVGWTPCVGGVLSSILIYASTLNSLPRAAVLLLSYSLGLGVPFFVAGLAINQFLFIFNRFKGFMRFVPIITGVFLIFIGVILFSGQFSKLAAIGTISKKAIPAEKVSKLSQENFKPAPEFMLLDINGNQRRLSDFKNKVIILDFWATWCPPCRAEIPHFIELYSRYKDKGLEVIGVALDWNAKRVVGPFVKENNINYTVLLGNQEVSDLYGGIGSIPTTFVLDRGLKIRKRYIGYREKEEFERDIKELL